MSDKIIDFERILQERNIKQQFPTDYELVVAFYLAKRLCAEDLGDKDGELYCADPDTLQRWVQKRLADEVETRGVRAASIYKMIPYVARMLVCYEGLSIEDWTPTKGLQRHLESESTFELLQVAETSFMAFCFYPEERERRQLRYREYAHSIGTQAYVMYGVARKNPLGSCMETAFAPLGSLVRDLFLPHQ